MRFSVNIKNMTRIDVSVPLGGREAGVAQKLLNRTEIRPSLEKMGREAMSEGVRADLSRDGDLPNASRHQGSDTSIGQSTPALVDKQCLGATRQRRLEREPGSHGVSCTPPEGDDTLLLALAHHAGEASLEVDLGDIETHELGAPKTGGVEQLQNGPGPHRDDALAGGVEERSDFALLEVGGDAPLGPGGQEGASGVPGEDSLSTQPTEEGAKASELPRGGCLLQSSRVKVGQERADQQVVDVSRGDGPAQLGAGMRDELAEVVSIRPHGVRGGVLLQ